MTRLFPRWMALLLLAITSIPVAHACEGRTVDTKTGTPIAGAIVTHNTTTTSTDAAGRFQFDGACGTLKLRAIGYQRTQSADNAAPDHTDWRLSPITPKGVYLSFWGIGSRELREDALALLDRTELNALVIDVKGDRGGIPYPSHIAMASAIGARQTTTVSDMPALLAHLKARGAYLIARIVVFKDDPLATAHPEWAVHRADGSLFRDRENLAWVDPSRREVWDYNLDIAAEAAAMGFDEIQFDYVRFPDEVGLRFGVDNTENERVAAIHGFLTSARQRLAPYNVFVAADIFGYVAWNNNDTFIGQRLDALIQPLDYISLMLYPSGFKFGIPGYSNPVEHPNEIVRLTLDRAVQRTRVAPQRFRPWLQAFRDYAFDHRTFGGPEVRAQIDAANQAGSNGWLLWNPRNVYSADGLRAEKPEPTQP